MWQSGYGISRFVAVKGLFAFPAPVFLALKGHDFQAPEDDLAETVLAVARVELGKSGMTVFLRRWSAEP